LINSSDLVSMRNLLCNFLVDNRILIKKENRKGQNELSITNLQELRKH